MTAPITRRRLSAAGLGLLARPLAAQPATLLTFGQSAEPNSADPHFFNGTANKALSTHIFDRLVEQTASIALEPGLATRWRPTGETVWEFTLRPGVRFSDGAALTPGDVAFSVERTANVPNTPGGFGGVVRSIIRTEVLDETTIHFHTRRPGQTCPTTSPTLPSSPATSGRGPARRTTIAAKRLSAPAPTAWSASRQATESSWCATRSGGGRRPPGTGLRFAPFRMRQPARRRCSPATSI